MSFSTFLHSLFIIPGPVVGVLGPILTSIGQVWAATWWFFLPIIAAIIFWEAWLLYVHIMWLQSIKWVVLEIKVPKNILKTPKAMEQIFAAAHTPYSYGLRWQDKYFRGVDEAFFSFELVGRGGETHFYLRTPTRFRNMMESAIFAQYPEAEITEVDDYLHEMPHNLPNDELDLAGYEIVFRKPDWYPIRTYPEFEEAVEEHRVDPIAPLIEAMEKMQGDQQLWIQFVVVPAGEDWAEKGRAEINKIYGLDEKKEHGGGGFLPKFDLGFTLGEALRAPFEPPGGHSAGKHEEKPAKQPRLVLSNMEKDAVEGISHKISKLAFHATIRFMTIERRGENPHGLMSNLFLTLSYLRQFNNQTLQATRPDGATRTFSIYGMFRNYKQNYRKRILYERYHHLAHNHHAPVFNIEELATMYHFPIGTVATTGLEKVESKKGAPPASLPIVEESELLDVE